MRFLLQKHALLRAGNSHLLLSAIKNQPHPSVAELLCCRFRSSSKHELFSSALLNRDYCQQVQLGNRPRLLFAKQPSSDFSKISRRISWNTQRIVDSGPRAAQPYLQLIRIDKPVGTWLLYWPCAWGIAMAAGAGELPDIRMLALFGGGAIFMRSAGCIVNDMWDKDLDRQVERTKNRPLASGRLGFVPALVLLAGNLGLALVVLLQLNWLSILLGASSLLLVFTYPVFKRLTYYPQIVLGLALNWGAILGYTAITVVFDLTIVLPLYIAGVLWTVVYDTIYAHQDKSDDIRIGVKSTALKFGDRTPDVLWKLSAAMVSMFGVSGYMADMAWPFYLGLTGIGVHLTYQTFAVDLESPADCMRKFHSNIYLGAIAFISIVFGNLLKTEDISEKKQEQE